MIGNNPSANTIRLARVTHVHPEGQKMEVIFLDTGDYGRDVQVMTPYGGTDFGFTGGIPSPDEEGHDFNMEENDPGKRHIVAVVATFQGIHVCLGYLYPQCTHMAFKKDTDKNRLVERHTSDFIRTISDAGDMDMVHPGGAHLRIGNGSVPDSLAGNDYDGVFATKHNTGSTPTVTLENSSGGGTSRVKQMPGGYIDVYAKADWTYYIEGNAAEIIDGWWDVTVKGNIDISTFQTFTLNSQVAKLNGSTSALLKSNGIAKVKAPSVILEADDQVTSDAPITYIKGSLIVAGSVSIQGGDGTVSISAANINLKGQVNVDGDINI